MPGLKDLAQSIKYRPDWSGIRAHHINIFRVPQRGREVQFVARTSPRNAQTTYLPAKPSADVPDRWAK
jgi:hypothetical protein